MTKTLLFLLLLAAPVSAQTPPIDDCPANHQLHPALTKLDDVSMLAAYRASFIGEFHREPTMVNQSGSDDGWYWIHTANHYGPYSDDVCRAGWNLYRERQMAGRPTGPAEGDQPAEFQPNVTPLPPPPPPPPPTPTGLCDEACLSRVLAPLLSEMQATHVDVKGTRSAVEDVRDNTNWFVSGIKNTVEWGWKTGVIPAIVGYFGIKQVMR